MEKTIREMPRDAELIELEKTSAKNRFPRPKRSTIVALQDLTRCGSPTAHGKFVDTLNAAIRR
jgi:hypothetical protein